MRRHISQCAIRGRRTGITPDGIMTVRIESPLMLNRFPTRLLLLALGFGLSFAKSASAISAYRHSHGLPMVRAGWPPQRGGAQAGDGVERFCEPQRRWQF
jgi:hypothetical protein